MKKKMEKSKVRNPKLLKLSKETLCLLESPELAHVAGGNSRSLCEGTAACCNWH
jgi:hypothetical protein